MSNQPNPSASGECCSFSKRVSWHIDFHFEHGDEVIHLVPKFCPWCGTPKTQPSEQHGAYGSPPESATKHIEDLRESVAPQVSDAARNAYETEISRDSSREHAGYLVPEKGLAIQRAIDAAIERTTASLEKQLADSNNLIEQVCVVFLSPPSREQLPRIVHELNKQLAEAREEVARLNTAIREGKVTATPLTPGQFPQTFADVVKERDALRQQVENSMRDAFQVLPDDINEGVRWRDIAINATQQLEEAKKYGDMVNDRLNASTDTWNMLVDTVRRTHEVEEGPEHDRKLIEHIAGELSHARLLREQLESSQRREAAIQSCFVQCTKCNGKKGFEDTTYDRTGVWTVCLTCCGTGTMVEVAKLLGIHSQPDSGKDFVHKSEVEKLQAELFKVREECDSAKRMYEELNAAATNKRDDTP